MFLQLLQSLKHKIDWLERPLHLQHLISNIILVFSKHINLKDLAKKTRMDQNPDKMFSKTTAHFTMSLSYSSSACNCRMRSFSLHILSLSLCKRSSSSCSDRRADEERCRDLCLLLAGAEKTVQTKCLMGTQISTLRPPNVFTITSSTVGQFFHKSLSFFISYKAISFHLLNKQHVREYNLFFKCWNLLHLHKNWHQWHSSSN